MNARAAWHLFWFVVLFACAVASADLQARTSGAWRWAYIAALVLNSVGVGHEAVCLMPFRSDGVTRRRAPP